MDTTRLQENISAMVDGELPACDAELTTAALAGAAGRRAWQAYQLIGDVLRAQAGGMELSADFGSGLADRLAREGLPESAGQGAPSAAAAAPSAAVQPAPQSRPSQAQSAHAQPAPAFPQPPQPQPSGDSNAPVTTVTR